MSELAELIADQERDRLCGHRARDVFDPHSIPFLPVGDNGLLAYSRGRKLLNIEHGKLHSYKRHRCRCTKCRAANAAYQRDWRHRQHPVPAAEATASG